MFSNNIKGFGLVMAAGLVIAIVLSGCMNFIQSSSGSGIEMPITLRSPILFPDMQLSEARYIVPTAYEVSISIVGERNDFRIARRARLTVEEGEVVGHVEFADIPVGYTYTVSAAITDEESNTLYIGSTDVSIVSTRPTEAVINLIPDSSLYEPFDADGGQGIYLPPGDFGIYSVYVEPGEYTVLFDSDQQIPEDILLVVLDQNWNRITTRSPFEIDRAGTVYIAVQNTAEEFAQEFFLSLEYDLGETDDPEADYKIGDQGPAGGVVFYSNSNPDWEQEDGWLYLEAAPADQSEAIEFAPEPIMTGSTFNGIGRGALNTEALQAAIGPGEYAASQAAAYGLNDYTDWFLPSRDELLELYNQKNEAGGFVSQMYWSSSEAFEGQVYTVSFDSGETGTLLTGETAPVRAIRAFRDEQPLQVVMYQAADDATGRPPLDPYHYVTGENAIAAGPNSLFISAELFAGWSSNPESGAAEYITGQEIEMGVGNMQLFANFTPYTDINRATVADRDGLLSADPIDNSDGNMIPINSVLLFITSEGNYGKMLLTGNDGGGGIEFDYITWDGNGDIIAQGNAVTVAGTWSYDLDDAPDQELDGNADFWLRNISDTERQIPPLNDARLYLPGR